MVNRCKKCNIEITPVKARKSGLCRKCWRKEHTEKNRDKLSKQHQIRYDINKDRWNAMAKAWQKKHGDTHDHRAEPRRSNQLIKDKTRYYYPIREGQKCEFCSNLAEQHHHYTNPIQIELFWFVCKKCHNKIHHPRTNGELKIDGSHYTKINSFVGSEMK